MQQFNDLRPLNFSRIIIILSLVFAFNTSIIQDKKYTFSNNKNEIINLSTTLTSPDDKFQNQIFKIETTPVRFNANFMQKKLLKNRQGLQPKKYKKPWIDIVSESLCPFCKTYSISILEALLEEPEFEKLVNLNYKFWGNAVGTYNEKTKRYDFECQHGTNECFGNAMFTCASRMLSKRKALSFVLCVYADIASFNKDFLKTGQYCMTNYPRDFSKIKTCMISSKGNQWMYEDSIFTGDNNYVPYVIFNGKHNKEKQAQFKENPLKFLCNFQYNKHNNKDLCEKILEKNKQSSNF